MVSVAIEVFIESFLFSKNAFRLCAILVVSGGDKTIKLESLFFLICSNSVDEILLLPRLLKSLKITSGF
jgi:hypothetical protein